MIMRRFQACKLIISEYFDYLIRSEKQLEKLKGEIGLEDEVVLLKFISIIFDKEDKLNAIGFRNSLKNNLGITFQSDKFSRRFRTEPNLAIMCFFKRTGCFKVSFVVIGVKG